jgi:hypothetical protein
MKRARVLVGVLSLVVFHSAAEAAVILGQLQTFDDPHGWVIGAGPVIQNPTAVPVLLGGPGGPGDPYLSIVSTGAAGPGSRLSAQNFGEWSGDYLAAGIDRIEMNVRNFGNTDVHLRLLFLELAPFPVNMAFSTQAIVVPAGTDWTSIQFNITPGALTSPLGSAAGALSNASELRIFHNPAPFFIDGQMPAIAANVGVDNIRALAPEPATLWLFGAAAFVGARRRWTARHR